MRTVSAIAMHAIPRSRPRSTHGRDDGEPASRVAGHGNSTVLASRLLDHERVRVSGAVDRIDVARRRHHHGAAAVDRREVRRGQRDVMGVAAYTAEVAW